MIFLFKFLKKIFKYITNFLENLLGSAGFNSHLMLRFLMKATIRK